MTVCLAEIKSFFANLAKSLAHSYKNAMQSFRSIPGILLPFFILQNYDCLKRRENVEYLELPEHGGVMSFWAHL